MKKRLLAVLTAVLMILALAVPVFAAGNDGSITVKNATKGETYKIYKVFDLTYSDGGDNNTNVAYQYVKKDGTDNLYDALTATDSVFSLKLAAGTTNSYIVKQKEGKTEAEVVAFVEGLYDDGLLTQQGDSIEATSDTVKFENLPYGYYLVTSTLNAGGAVTIDSTLKDVTVIDKNQMPTWEDFTPGGGPTPAPGDEIIGKVIDLGAGADPRYVPRNSTNFEDTTDFIIGVNATNYVGDEQVANYYITDKMMPNIKYDLEEGIAKIDKVTVDGVELTKDTDWTITMTKNGTDIEGFKITIPWIDADKASLYAANSVIRVYYHGLLDTTTAVVGPTGNLNTANFLWDTVQVAEPQATAEGEKVTTTYTYSIELDKVDEDGVALATAEFVIEDAEGNEIPVTETTTAGTYNYDAASTNTTVVSPESGVILVKGLAEGTYTITETKAPLGYNLLEETKTAVLNKTNGNATITVTNTTGPEFPSTGGIGTTIFYIIGGALVALAIILLIVRRRVRK